MQKSIIQPLVTSYQKQLSNVSIIVIGNGYIGSYLSKSLKDLGLDCRVWTRQDNDYTNPEFCFDDFIDGRSLEIRDISEDIQAYVLFFTAPFIASLMKNTAPFPPSYILHTKAWPVSVLSSEVTERIQKRMSSIVESLKDESHHFYTEMLSCTLRIYLMDIANEFIRQENEGGAQMEVSRKHILFKQFTGLLIAHIQEEHSVNWYASQLCVTPQYLNRAIKSITQKTVYEHISIALTGSIIEQLEISEKPISQIAEDFHFPDLATMTKFFKRKMGKTPTEYRKSARA